MVYGGSKTDYRLQYCGGLFDPDMKEMRLTDAKTGEKLSNFQSFTKVADRTGIQGASDSQSPKSLFEYNQIPSKVAASAKAWFYGKLLLAAFCETWANSPRTTTGCSPTGSDDPDGAINSRQPYMHFGAGL
jgi:hypothetical protein